MARDVSHTTHSPGLSLFRSRRALFVLGVITLLGVLPALVWAEAPPQGQEANVDAQLKEDLGVLASAKIFFGHHSVGDNLLQGLKDLSAEAGVPVKVTELRPGKNGDPKAKVDDWLKAVLALPKGDAEVVMMKLCYADFSPMTKPDELLAHYRAAVARVRAERPELTIVHFTAPVTVPKDDLKSKLKRMIGKEVWEDQSALQRQAYNDQLRAAFPSEPLFDLARWESTRPSGQVERFPVNGKDTEALVEAYTTDGGHLNALGMKAGARALVRTLATTVKAQQVKAAAEPTPAAQP